MIASDLDGTLRRAREPFGTWRDEARSPIVRLLSGKLAALTAERINRHLDADVYITGSPRNEDAETRVWLAAHGMRGVLVSDGGWDRRDPSVKDTLAHKAECLKIFSRYGVTEYYEDEKPLAESLRKALRGLGTEVVDV